MIIIIMFVVCITVIRAPKAAAVRGVGTGGMVPSGLQSAAFGRGSCSLCLCSSLFIMLCLFHVMLVFLLFSCSFVRCFLSAAFGRGCARRGSGRLDHYLHFSICACHPCAGAMLILSVPISTDDPRRLDRHAPWRPRILRAQITCCLPSTERLGRLRLEAKSQNQISSNHREGF